MRWSVRGSAGSIVLAAGLSLLIGPRLGLGDPGTELVVVRDGAPHSVPVTRGRGYPVVAGPDLAEALGYTWLHGDMMFEGARVRFQEDSPFFVVDSAVHQLPNAVYRVHNTLMIPTSWALDWLPRSRPERWDNMDGRLVARGTPIALRRPADRKWLVVIDPGHGGPDPGTIGVHGTREKDVALAIGKKLAARLDARPDIDIMLTRDRDTLIALEDRPRITRIRGVQRAPDLFVSVHCNSMPHKPNPTRGFETYFLAVAKTEQARRVALRENASLKFEGKGDSEKLDPLQFILSDLRLTGNLRESRLLATDINRQLDDALSAPDMGVRQAGFWVLVGATMPSVLVEVGYLSNSREEKLLRSGSYQTKIADALADAVADYLAGYAQRLWSSYAGGD